MSTNSPTAIAPAIELSPVEGALNNLPEQDTKSATGAADIEKGAETKGAGIAMKWIKAEVRRLGALKGKSTENIDDIIREAEADKWTSLRFGEDDRAKLTKLRKTMSWLAADGGAKKGKKRGKKNKGKNTKNDPEEWKRIKKVHIFADGVVVRGMHDGLCTVVYGACEMEIPEHEEITRELVSVLGGPSDESTGESSCSRDFPDGSDEEETRARANAEAELDEVGEDDPSKSPSAAAKAAAKIAKIAKIAAAEATSQAQIATSMLRSMKAACAARDAVLHLQNKIEQTLQMLSIYTPLQSICEVVTMFEQPMGPNGKDIPKSWADLKAAHDMRVQDGEIDDEMSKVTGKPEHEDNCDGDDENDEDYTLLEDDDDDDEVDEDDDDDDDVGWAYEDVVPTGGVTEIEVTKDVRKWIRKSDKRLVKIFIKKIKRLSEGDHKTYCMRKRLKGGEKNFFESKLTKVSIGFILPCCILACCKCNN
jgi:hypothetical protein